MRILFLDAYFEPEQIAFTHLEDDLLEGLVEAGHEVEVVCPTPSRGVSKRTIKQYKRRKTDFLFNGHVHVTRFYAPCEGKNLLVRAIRYFWCNIRTYQIGKRYSQVDAVFSNSTPPTQGWIAGMVAKEINAPFIYSLQDVFPDSLVTTGISSEKSLLYKIGRKIETATYKNCHTIIVISDSIKKNLLRKGVNPKKIRVISNWIDTNKIKPIARKDNLLFDKFGISRDKFVVLYAGNIGAAQGTDIIFEAADNLKDIKNIQFVILGGGFGYPEAEKKAKNLSNVFIHPLLPQDMVSNVYSMGDVALITCKKGVGKSGMPSKIWSIMSCNTPIIAAFDRGSELEKHINKSQSGICINPEDPVALAKAIIEFYEVNKKLNISRDYVMENASKNICVRKYIDCFLNR